MKKILIVVLMAGLGACTSPSADQHSNRQTNMAAVKAGDPSASKYAQDIDERRRKSELAQDPIRQRQRQGESL